MKHAFGSTPQCKISQETIRCLANYFAEESDMNSELRLHDGVAPENRGQPPNGKVSCRVAEYLKYWGRERMDLCRNSTSISRNVSTFRQGILVVSIIGVLCHFTRSLQRSIYSLISQASIRCTSVSHPGMPCLFIRSLIWRTSTSSIHTCLPFSLNLAPRTSDKKHPSTFLPPYMYALVICLLLKQCLALQHAYLNKI